MTSKIVLRSSDTYININKTEHWHAAVENPYGPQADAFAGMVNKAGASGIAMAATQAAPSEDSSPSNPATAAEKAPVATPQNAMVNPAVSEPAAPAFSTTPEVAPAIAQPPPEVSAANWSPFS